MVKPAHIRWWHWIPRRRWRIVAHVTAADEVPNRLPLRGVIVVGDDEHHKWIAFDCPCMSDHRIMLNADPARHPRWRIDTPSPLTLHPSIDALTTHGRCHYLIRRGTVHWVP